MINTICGRRLPDNYEVHQPDWDTLEVRRGNGALLATLRRGAPRVGGDQWLFCDGDARRAALVLLDADIEAERLEAMDREAHKRMRAATLSRRKHVARNSRAGRTFL
jgi:hypothetical protein